MIASPSLYATRIRHECLFALSGRWRFRLAVVLLCKRDERAKGLADTYHSRSRYGHVANGSQAGLREARPETPLLRSREIKVLGAIEVAHHRLLPGEVELLPIDGHQVNVHLSSAAHHLVQQRNERTHEGLKAPRAVDIVPAGTPAYFRMDAASEHACILLKDRFVRRVADEAGVDFDKIEVVPCFNAAEPQIERIGLCLLSEMQSAGLAGELYAESLANVLALQLLRGYSSLGRAAKRRTQSGAGGLSRRELKQTTDYINDNLARKLTLAEIADSAHMSPFHFARSFKAATGLSPHQYVIHRRVERARDRLSSANPTIGEVARAVGFSSASHLAHHVRRLLGVSPLALRREAVR